MTYRTKRTTRTLVRTASVLALVGLLAACSSIPRERTSPCACDWRPLTQQTETTA